MEENFFHFHADVLAKQHETDHLQRSKMRELVPFNVKVKQVSALLLFFCICSDLLDGSVDKILGVAVDGSQVFSCHHLVISWNAAITFLLVFKELFT